MKYILLIGVLTFTAHRALCQHEGSASAPPAGVQASTSLSGKVVQTMEAGTYTYILVDTGTNKAWAAAPKFEVKVGDSVVVAQALAMPNYHSKTLNRDFNIVYFTDGVTVNGGQSTGGGKAHELPKNHLSIANASAAPKIDLSGIKKAEGGQTVAEIFADKAKLSGQQVKVRGKVVRYNPMILGKNWLHVQDGTIGAGSSYLTVTTASQAKVGDTVLVMGTVSVNKDFGYGYKYAVIIEDAKVVVE
jgi:hypothetical protein